MAKEKIVVYATSANKYHKTGSPIVCATQEMADHLIKNGMAKKSPDKTKDGLDEKDKIEESDFEKLLEEEEIENESKKNKNKK